MNTMSIAPCGVICDLCLGFQRDKNSCVGCRRPGDKTKRCSACSIKLCQEKGDDENLLCSICPKFPCRRIRNLDKRYATRYGESPVQNLMSIRRTGMKEFIRTEKEKWTCTGCGQLLCVHRNVCLICGAKNPFFPENV